MKVSDYIMSVLSDEGVKDVFYLPGGGCMYLIDALQRNENLKKHCCLHEQAAVIEADAYAQYTQNIGAAIVTTGPGATNAITAVAASYIDSVPLIVISGQVKREDIKKNERQLGIQEVDIISMVRGITKYAIQVKSARDVLLELDKAIECAREGRMGPVWIDIPLDVQNEDIEVNIIDINDLLSKSKRPVILAGNGCRDSKYVLINTITKTHIPLMLTWRAADLVEEDFSYFYGRPGGITQQRSKDILNEADLLICLGARLDKAQVGYNYDSLAPNAKVLVVDIDIAELDKIKDKRFIKVNTNAVSALEKIWYGNYRTDDSWIERCDELNVVPRHVSNYKINPYEFIEKMSDIVPEYTIIVPASSGSAAEMFMQTWIVKRGQVIINSPGLGSMGFGLPAAIGLARSLKKKVICIIGDGDLQHNIQELATAKDLDIHIFVLNNGGYNSIKNTQTNYFNGRLLGCNKESGLCLPDIASIGIAYGLRSVVVDNLNNVDWMIKNSCATIYDVIVDETVKTEPKNVAPLKRTNE